MDTETRTKSDVFAVEIDYIKDEKIRESARKFINELPDYYFQVPASSTGKYHPRFSAGEGGLYRHVKVAVRYAIELFNIYKFDDETKDLIVFALIIHDGLKKGEVEERYTKHTHPLLIGEFFKRKAKELNLDLSNEQIERIVKMDASHSGRWNTNNYDPTILPLPKTVEEKFVHMCDYLSSRKFNNVAFEKDAKGVDCIVELDPE